MANTPGIETTLSGDRLSGEVEAFLYGTNPWWQGKPMRPLPLKSILSITC